MLPGSSPTSHVPGTWSSSLGARDAEVTEAVLSTFEALAAGLDDDAERQIVTGDRALLPLGRVSSGELPALEAYRSAATIVLARGTLWAGRLDEAQALLERAASALAAPAARTPVLSVHVHANLALIKALRGHLRGAAQEADLAMGVAERSGWLFLPQSATAFLARAVVHLGRAEPAQCSVAVERGRSCVGGLPDRFTATALALRCGPGWTWRPARSRRHGRRWPRCAGRRRAGPWPRSSTPGAPWWRRRPVWPREIPSWCAWRCSRPTRRTEPPAA